MPVKTGERRLIDGQVAEWDGTGWLPVEASKPEPETAPSGLQAVRAGFMSAPWGPVASAAAMVAPLGVGAVGGAAGKFVSGAMLKRMAAGAAAGAAAESLPVIGSGKPMEGAKLGAMLGMGQGGLGALWKFGKKRQLIEKIADWAGGRAAGPSVKRTARSAAKRASASAAPKAAAGGTTPSVSTIEEQLRATIAQNAARSAGAVSRVAAPTSTSATQAAAQALEAKIVDMAMRQKLSDAQIQQVLLQQLGKNLRPSEAKAMVKMVLRNAGIKPSKIGAMQ